MLFDVVETLQIQPSWMDANPIQPSSQVIAMPNANFKDNKGLIHLKIDQPGRRLSHL